MSGHTYTHTHTYTYTHDNFAVRMRTEVNNYNLYCTEGLYFSAFINPRRACAARVTVIVLYVCLSVCTRAILAVREIKSIMKATIVLSIRFAAILKWCFSLNCLIRKLQRFLLTLVGAAIFS